MSTQNISIEKAEIETAKSWLEPEFIRDIEIFYGFHNFYQRYISSFSQIMIWLTKLLKTIFSLKILFSLLVPKYT